MDKPGTSEKDVIIIGIAGGTGSGKSTLIQKIKNEFNEEITIISHDFYYKEHSDLTLENGNSLIMIIPILLILT